MREYRAKKGFWRGKTLPAKHKKYEMAEAVQDAYRSGEDDESLEPRVLADAQGKPIGRFQDGDYVVFYNIRGEREVELCRSLLEKDFSHFPVEKNIWLNFVTMIAYDKRLQVKVAFPPEEELCETLSAILSRHGLRQAKISESEKAIHVSYFLNGKVGEPFAGEERIVVPTPKDVPYLDQKPEMNAAGVADAVIEKMEDPKIHFLFANFANIDVVGHIENEGAIKKAAETVDFQLGRCLEAARKNGLLTLITADHGTAEKWYYPDGSIDTGHTVSPVPFLVVDPDEEERFFWKLREDGELADVAPTLLQIFGLPQPAAMTGRSLLRHRPREKKSRILLLLLDGWGFRAEVEGNLIAQAHTPVMDDLQVRYPFTTLKASGEAVGLPEGTVGNSEAGHLHIGAGRRIYSDRLRIDRAIEDESFFENEAFLWAMQSARKEGKNLHLLGIVSFFSSHGSVNHLLSLLKLAKRESLQKIYLHAMLGRRGEHKESGARYIELIEKEMENLALGQVASVIGRYWSLDREENWDRIEKTYRMLVYGQGKPISLP
jgi:2,3-bisphosphoglycerate-independent phosphoglycerate mutase